MQEKVEKLSQHELQDASICTKTSLQYKIHVSGHILLFYCLAEALDTYF